MTLPNRPGYSVEDKKSTPPSGGVEMPMHHLPPQVHHQPPPMPNDHHMASLFPFLGSQADVVKIVERSLNYPPELAHAMEQNVAPVLNSRFDGMFKGGLVEPLTTEELQARKNFIRSHRLLPITIEFMTQCKKEGISPSAETFTYMQDTPQPGSIDFGLDDFLISQGIETGPLDDGDDPDKSAERDEFLYKLEQLKEKYNEELEKLNRVCAEFCSRMFNLLREQSTLRPLSDQETQMKLHGIQQKFDYVKNQLRQNVCNAIVALEKQYNHSKKKRRALPKKAAESLSNWFFEHLNDPYPSEEEKSILAAAGGLTITQVNNWFGNKRIRYKRKCLEEEAKRAGLEGRVVEPTSPLSQKASPTRSTRAKSSKDDE